MGTQAKSNNYGALATAASPAPHPSSTAWVGSRLFLSWVSPLMALGQRKQLSADDIWGLEKKHQSKVVSATFTAHFDATRSIPRAFIKSFGWRFGATGVAFFVGLVCSLVGPVVLNHVVSSLTSAAYSVTDIFTWVVVLFASQVFRSLMDTYANFESELIAIDFVGCLKSLLYSKTMRLSSKSRMEKSTGDITNIYTSDSDSILEVAYSVHQLWLIPLQIAVVSYMLYNVLNVAAFAGIGIIKVKLQ